jgi:hypothetical protein
MIRHLRFIAEKSQPRTQGKMPSVRRNLYSVFDRLENV